MIAMILSTRDHEEGTTRHFTKGSHTSAATTRTGSERMSKDLIEGFQLYSWT